MKYFVWAISGGETSALQLPMMQDRSVDIRDILGAPAVTGVLYPRSVALGTLGDPKYLWALWHRKCPR